MSLALGSPSGDHRVLEPPGATTATAHRLDALGELWDGEVRIDLEALVLDDADVRRLHARLGTEAAMLTAALLETVAERGGLDGEAGRGTYLGTVAAVGREHPWPAAVGERVALALPAVAVPAFAVPGRWDGRSPVVPLRGHAVAPAGVPTVFVPEDVSATAARILARFADIPAALDAMMPPGPVGRFVVLGGDTEPGAIALRELAARQVPVAAVVETLAGARLARALGAGEVAVADLGDAPGSAQVIDEATAGRFAAAVVATSRAMVLAVRVAETILLLDDTTSPAALAEHATAAARSVTVLQHRRPGAGRGARVRELVASSPDLAEVLRWHTGHPVPGTAGRGSPPWERT